VVAHRCDADVRLYGILHQRRSGSDLARAAADLETAAVETARPDESYPGIRGVEILD